MLDPLAHHTYAHNATHSLINPDDASCMAYAAHCTRASEGGIHMNPPKAASYMLTTNASTPKAASHMLTKNASSPRC